MIGLLGYPWIWKGLSATCKVADTPFHIQGDGCILIPLEIRQHIRGETYNPSLFLIHKRSQSDADSTCSISNQLSSAIEPIYNDNDYFILCSTQWFFFIRFLLYDLYELVVLFLTGIVKYSIDILVVNHNINSHINRHIFHYQWFWKVIIEYLKYNYHKWARITSYM